MKVDRGKCSRACSREPACSHCFPKCVSRVPATIRAARYVGSEIMENVCLSVFFHIFPRWTEKDPPALAEASCFPDVTENISPFVENQINEIGRASCRERVCQYVYISVVAVSLKKKKTNNTNKNQ